MRAIQPTDHARATGASTMMVSAQRLNDCARDGLVTHFLALSDEDRRLRFGSRLSPEGVVAYVSGIDFRRDVVFAVRDDRLQLLGVAHLAFGKSFAELGLSVLPPIRGQGVGNALFDRAATHARNRGIPRLYMHCLAENQSIMRLARKFGMSIVTDSGDADAYLQLPPATPTSIAGEIVIEGFAQYDYALKLQMTAWHCICAPLSDAAPAPAPRPVHAA